ncbi:hypothetical protein [Curtobacterium flaccumfaciens]|nr:hypothetical protein [Curtobacterium flaccumfaciens]
MHPTALGFGRRHRPTSSPVDDPLPGGVGQHLVDPLVTIEFGELGETL